MWDIIHWNFIVFCFIPVWAIVFTRVVWQKFCAAWPCITIVILRVCVSLNQSQWSLVVLTTAGSDGAPAKWSPGIKMAKYFPKWMKVTVAGLLKFVLLATRSESGWLAKTGNDPQSGAAGPKSRLLFCLNFTWLIPLFLSLQRTYTLIVEARDWDNGTRNSKSKLHTHLNAFASINCRWWR